MVETRKLAVILAADVVVVSRFEGADEVRTLVLRRPLRGDLFDLAISAASPPATTSAPETSSPSFAPSLRWPTGCD
jgi:hypothetical protein